MLGRRSDSIRLIRPSRPVHPAAEILQRVGILPILIVVLFVFFGLREPRFLRAENLYTVLTQSVYLVMITLAQTVVLLTGGFDMSVGSSVALTSIVVGQILVAYANNIAAGTALASIAGVGVGIAIGVINGGVISLFSVSPFIVTLEHLQGMIDNKALAVAVELEIPDRLHIGPRRAADLAGDVGADADALNWTRFGRYIYALGGTRRRRACPASPSAPTSG